ncbi:hypothetical protein LZC95_16830 [Pendulispora brunnea]|uniref:Uncharacterized protein n=1 Tax=Pendulispora brunnea TaxID=2905690 RepID=A0ABZ2KIH8_9BACT
MLLRDLSGWRLLAVGALLVGCGSSSDAPMHTVSDLGPGSAIAAVVGPEFTMDDLPLGTAHASSPVVATDGASFLLVYDGGNGATRVAADGQVLDPRGIALPPGAERASVAFGGGYYLVARQRFQGASDGVEIVRMTPDGTVVDATPITVASSGYRSLNAVTFDGTNFLVAAVVATSEITTSVHAWRVTPAGAVLDASPIVVADGVTGQSLAAAFSGTHHVIAFDYGGRASTFCARQIAPDGALGGSGCGAATYAFLNPHPDVACDGAGGCFLTWSDVDADFARGIVMGARLGPDGGSLDGDYGFRISKSTFFSSSPRPVVRWDGTQYTVLWLTDDGYGVRGARVKNGATVDASDRVLGTTGMPEQSLSLAWSATGGLLAWDFGNPNGYLDANAVRIDRPLTRQGAVFPIAFARPQEFRQAVASNGSGYLALWTAHGPSTAVLLAARTDAAGNPLDASPLRINEDGSNGNGVAASIGSDYLAVWSGMDGVYARSIGADGTMGTPFRVSAPAAPGADERFGSVRIVASSEGYLVGWVHEIVTNDPESGIPTIEDRHVVARVSKGGVVRDPQGLVLATADYSARPASLASDGTNFVALFDRGGATGRIVSVTVDAATGAIGPQVQVASGNNVATGEGSGGIGYAGGQYLAVWWNAVGANASWLGARLDGNGVPKDANPFTVTTAPGSFGGITPTASGFHLVWTNKVGNASVFDVYGAEVSADGVVGPSDVLFSAVREAPYYSPAVVAARSPGQALVVYGRLEDDGHERSNLTRARALNLAAP